MLRLALYDYVPALLGILSGPLLARALAPSGRGELAAALALTTVVSSVVSLGMPSAIGYYVSEGISPPRLFATGIRYSVWTLPVFLIAGEIAVHFPLNGYPDATKSLVLLLLALSPLGILAACVTSLLLTDGALQPVGRLRAIPLVGSALATVFLYVTGELSVRSYLLIQVLILVGTCAAAIKMLGIAPRSAYPVWPCLRFGTRTSIGSLAAMGNRRLDQLIVAPIVGRGQLGIYAVAVSLASFPLAVAEALASRAYGRVAQAEGAEAKLATGSFYFRVCAILITVPCGLLALIVPYVLPIVYGSAFRTATTPFLLLLPGTIFLGLQAVTSRLLILLGRPGAGSVAEIVALVVTGVGLAVAITPLGIVGASLVSSVSYGVSLGVQICYLRKIGMRDLMPGMQDTRVLFLRLRRAPTSGTAARSA